MFRILTGGIAARLASYGVIGLGFWLLYRAFGSEAVLSGIAWGTGGGVLILAGMYLLVSVGRAGGFNHNPAPGDTPDSQTRISQASVEKEEGSPIDPVHGGHQGG